MNKQSRYIYIFLSFVFWCSSCTFIGKTIIGFNPNIDIEQYPNDVVQFYSQFSRKAPCNIYSFLNFDSLVSFNDTFQNRLKGKYPSIYLERNQSKQLLKLSCFDDLDYYVTCINADSIVDLQSNDTLLIGTIKNAIYDDCAELQSQETNLKGVWNVYIVYAQAMGKYVSNRYNILNNINDLRQINILDLSYIKSEGN